MKIAVPAEPTAASMPVSCFVGDGGSFPTSTVFVLPDPIHVEDPNFPNAVRLPFIIGPAGPLPGHPLITEEPLSAGTRLVNLVFQGQCTFVSGLTADIYLANVELRQSGTIAFITTVASLTEDHEAVITGGTDESHLAQGIALQKGAQAIQLTLHSDVYLEAGDRLVGFVALSLDTSTGETTYVAYVEY